MAVVTMAFAVLGFLSPSNRGGLMTALLLLFVLMGVLAGYVSAVMCAPRSLGHRAASGIGAPL